MRLMPLLLAAVSVCAYSDDRTFTFTHAQPGQDFNEAALALQRILFPAEVTSNESQLSVTVRGASASDISVAAFLFAQLDGVSASGAPQSIKTASGDVVGTVSQASAADVRGFQEAATAIRSVGEIRNLFTYSRLRLLVYRGSAAQAELTQWLASQFDQAMAGAGVPVTKQFPDLDPTANAVAILYLKSSPSLQSFQQSATEIRSATQIRRIFTYNAPRVIVARATPEQVANAVQIASARN